MLSGMLTIIIEPACDLQVDLRQNNFASMAVIDLCETSLRVEVYIDKTVRNVIKANGDPQLHASIIR